MDEFVSDETRPSLLSRLGKSPNDTTAWEQFVSRYSPRILEWCQRWNLQHEDAHEVTQMVLIRLAAKMRTFRYDPGRSFRGWLRTLTRHAWSDFATFQNRGAKGAKQNGMEVLQTVEARDDLEQRLAEAFDLELLESATSIVKQRVQSQTWQAFQLTAIDRLSGATAAKRLNMSVASVFKAKSNVQQMLRSTVEKLDTDR